MYLTEPPLQIVITFSHHFMFAYSFLARIIRVFPFISVFFFHQPCILWYLICVCMKMLAVCTYINQVRAFNALSCSAFYCSGGHKKIAKNENSYNELAGWLEKCLFPLLKRVYSSVTAMVITKLPEMVWKWMKIEIRASDRASQADTTKMFSHFSTLFSRYRSIETADLVRLLF